MVNAQVAELVDALASGASARKGVEVRVLSWAPFFDILCSGLPFRRHLIDKNLKIQKGTR